ncbi:MAG: ShlB/FhaC/HecB family hemolysin secretion/activation protein [Planctomycetes bacterium]|nr:ShlB/FhaC/HecB family hemolysin secretion/activation protein [Planctomycetota bacterium]
MKIRSAQAGKHILRWSSNSPQRSLDRVAAAVAMAAVLGASPALAQDDDPGPGSSETDTATEATQELPAPIEADGPSYPVSALVLQYLRENPQHPALEEVMQIEVALVQTAQGFVAPRAEVPSVRLRLAEIADRPVEPYYASAIQRILEEIRDFFSQREILGVYVAPDPFQINEAGDDLREDGHTALRVMITTGIVTELRTLASGKRIAAQERINNPLHDRIRERSPIQPSAEGDEAPGDLLRKDALDRYLFHLSRHPGRRVDASISAGLDPGGVALDYLITENRPLVLYAQVSNTGTRSTERWIERFGLFHTQLTNNDDILELSYTTAGFSDTNAVVGSYEAPLFDNDRLRWRAYGLWSEFTATDVGFFDDDFTGEAWELGGELIANIYQKRELFVDLVAGARFLNVRVDNKAAGIKGEEDFFLPHVGARIDRTSEWFSTQGSLLLEWNIGEVTDIDLAQLNALGRVLPDEDWAVLRWGLTHSVYLEPLFDREAWEDPTTPKSSTLAHELALSFKGQYAFERRLIPHAEQVVGGLYTVRGYPESVVAGDTAIIGSIEYRYHFPRAFEIQPEPRELFGEPFRAAPQYVYGRPDWDLILKGFFDVGRTIVSDRFAFESDETLMGAGVGVELLFKRNVSLRLDWGFVLEELEAQGINSGSNRLHVVATLLF